MQMKGKTYNGMADAMLTIMREEGMRGFFRGWTNNDESCARKRQSFHIARVVEVVVRVPTNENLTLPLVRIDFANPGVVLIILILHVVVTLKSSI